MSGEILPNLGLPFSLFFSLTVGLVLFSLKIEGIEAKFLKIKLVGGGLNSVQCSGGTNFRDRNGKIANVVCFEAHLPFHAPQLTHFVHCKS